MFPCTFLLLDEIYFWQPSHLLLKLVCTNCLYGLHHLLLINVLILVTRQTHLTPYVLHFLAETVPAISKLFIQNLPSVVILAFTLAWRILVTGAVDIPKVVRLGLLLHEQVIKLQRRHYKFLPLVIFE